MDEKLKHLEFIQGIISRMAHNSFLLKGWTVTLVTALFVIGKSDTTPSIFALCYLPTVLFFFLDGYFLWQERNFRYLYEVVSKKVNDQIDFSMKFPKLSKQEQKKNKLTYTQAIVSITLLSFYVGLCVIILLSVLYVTK